MRSKDGKTRLSAGLPKKDGETLTVMVSVSGPTGTNTYPAVFDVFCAKQAKKGASMADRLANGEAQNRARTKYMSELGDRAIAYVAEQLNIT